MSQFCGSLSALIRRSDVTSAAIAGAGAPSRMVVSNVAVAITRSRIRSSRFVFALLLTSYAISVGSGRTLCRAPSDGTRRPTIGSERGRATAGLVATCCSTDGPTGAALHSTRMTGRRSRVAAARLWHGDAIEFTRHLDYVEDLTPLTIALSNSLQMIDVVSQGAISRASQWTICQPWPLFVARGFWACSFWRWA